MGRGSDAGSAYFLLASIVALGASARDARAACSRATGPFAAPGDVVELAVRRTLCDGTSPSFTALADDHVVTLVFSPLAADRGARSS